MFQQPSSKRDGQRINGVPVPTDKRARRELLESARAMHTASLQRLSLIREKVAEYEDAVQVACNNVAMYSQPNMFSATKQQRYSQEAQARRQKLSKYKRMLHENNNLVLELDAVIRACQ